MKIYYDTEFLEDGHTIDLVSIGMFREDGKEYYAINAGMPWTRVMEHKWLAKNVVPHLPTTVNNNGRVLDLADPKVKPIGQIAEEVKLFIQETGPDAELWAWYAAFDHVVLSWLWGPMAQMPPGIPAHTRDIKQEYAKYGNPRAPLQHGLEHHALADAKHNKVRHDFIMTIEHERLTRLSRNV